MKHSYSTNRKQAKAKRSISSVRAKLLIYLSSDVRVRTFCSNMMPSPTLLPTRERERQRRIQTLTTSSRLRSIRATRQKRSYKPISGDFRLIVNQKIKRSSKGSATNQASRQVILRKGDDARPRSWIFSSLFFDAGGTVAGETLVATKVDGISCTVVIFLSRFLSIMDDLGPTVNDCELLNRK